MTNMNTSAYLVAGLIALLVVASLGSYAPVAAIIFILLLMVAVAAFFYIGTKNDKIRSLKEDLKYNQVALDFYRNAYEETDARNTDLFGRNLKLESQINTLELEKTALQKQIDTLRRATQANSGANKSGSKPPQPTLKEREAKAILQQALSVAGFRSAAEAARRKALEIYASQLQDRRTPVAELVEEALHQLRQKQPA